jgi:exosome complex RNA-binding protein Csl4
MQTMGQTDERPAPPQAERPDPAVVMRTCANCGATMEERKCKLICHGCGYFLSCSDYY